ncbi:MAG: AMP-binding protein, partial [Kofleriaceae bacterium]
MPGRSRIDSLASPPHLELPRDYNAAYDLLQRHVDDGRGDRVAVIDDDGRHTYRAVAERALRAAGALAALGVAPEQRVALCMLDSVDFVATFLGAIALGAVPVPLNTLLAADDYAYLVRDMRAAALIGSDALLGKLGGAVAGVRAAAGCPTALGVAPEQRVALCMLDSVDFVATFL